MRLGLLLGVRPEHHYRAEVGRAGRRVWMGLVRLRLLACVLSQVLWSNSLQGQRCCVEVVREAEAVVSILAHPHSVGLLTWDEEHALGQ